MAKISVIDEKAPQKAADSPKARPTFMPTNATVLERSERGGPKKITPPSSGKNAHSSPVLLPPTLENGLFEPPSDADNTWNSGKIEGLWTTDKPGNCWVYLKEEGWIKLSDASETGVDALMLLASVARDSASSFLYRKEKDGEIHEVYIW
jgi:hypothetical protein